MKIYGLTGGIGAGKSEASSGFADAGVPVIDADSIAHETLLPGGAVAEAIVKRFGEGVLVDGAIDRAKLDTYGVSQHFQSVLPSFGAKNNIY